jgi:hypothetical protein
MADSSPTSNARVQDIIGTETARRREKHTHMAATADEQDSEEANTQREDILTGARTSRTVTYCSAGVQTAPPKNAREFQRIHGREPAEQELVSRMGTAAIGHFGASITNPHEVIHSAPFSCSGDLSLITSYADASYQTADVAQCKMSIARTKVRTSMMVNKQRQAAHEAGYRVWSETQDEKIIHSEQFAMCVQFDKDGNATSGKVGGLLLPNIYGEEINPRLPLPQPIIQIQRGEVAQSTVSFIKEVDYNDFASTSGLTPPPTPPPAPLNDADRDRLHLRRISTIAPSVPREDTEPCSLEDYGYIRAVFNPFAMKNTKAEKEVIPDSIAEQDKKSEASKIKDKTILEVGGERFADCFIVYDPAEFVAMPTVPSTIIPITAKKRKASQFDCESLRSSSKRPKTSGDYSIAERSFQQQHIREKGAERDVRALSERTSLQAEEVGKARGQDTHLKDRSRSAHSTPRKDRTRASRRKSRSPDNRPLRNDHRSMSRTRREIEDSYEAERQRNAEARKKTQVENGTYEADERRCKKQEERKRAREVEQRRNLEQEERKRARGAEERQKQEEEGKKKAREAEERKLQEEKERDRRRIEKEDRRQAHEAEERQRQQGKERGRPRCRDRERERSSHRQKDTERRKTDSDTHKPAGEEDSYAKARAAEVAKRELAAKQNFPEKPVRHTRERSIERAKHPVKDDKRKDEKAKMDDMKVARPRLVRAARGELERYDPRKKFGR